LVDAKKEHTWLSEVPSHCLQQALRDLEEACRRHGTFNVRWRSARRWTPSFRFPEGSKMEREAEPAQISGESAQTGGG
jgi:putative transposase